ncbi:MAG TPA: PIN domain-containing protein [Candidatus Limnocylindrales bacterium]|nr:PIN domain-containing protein [Candidatus Limnocylindrales bacterium]
MIFVDTSFWVAFRHRDDDRHAESGRLFKAHGSRGLVTTNLVIGETWTYLRRRGGHRSAVGFLELTESTPVLGREHVGGELEAEALTWLRRHDERAYSFVDATSFAFMRRHGIEEAFAFDEDFSAAGFIELRA